MRKGFRGFTAYNMSKPGIRRAFVMLFLSAAVIFAFVGTFAMIQAERSMRATDLGKVTSHISPRTLIMIMAENIPYLRETNGLSGMDEIVGRIVFEAATSVNFRDPRTFLGRELPLFALFDSEIDMASAGVDYTSIPIESPPPPELEREIIKAMEQEEKKPEKPKEPVTPGNTEKQVIIYNTHFWESYLPEIGKKNPNQASDLNKNITLVSKHLAAEFEKLGIGAITTQRTYTWANSYQKSRKMVQEVMQRHPRARVLIDLHRDSNRRDKTTITVGGKTYARLAFVVGRSSKNYEENLRLAREMHQRINQLVPGLSKAVITKEREGGKNNGEYNQSLSPDSMLVEVGGVDNTFEEAFRSVEILARVVAERIHDAEPVIGRPASGRGDR
ncbi:stage II sporulation protein P [Staphylospora marina]|uniref:stage II sporulation protein P n=1 Tax=Staphylospora marina TaxID=2490858 RepID=UPI000F5C139C|nr:stage II sporulation protein P [Staphylospora marina]